MMIRSHRAPSGVMFGPHVTNLADGRALSDRHVAYYARRAAGGAGIIVTETASVHELDWPYERAPLAAECGPGWLATVAACGESLVIASLGHAGMQGSSAYSQRETWAPSGVPDAVTREMPKVMEADDIEAVIDGFARAAAVASAAGCGGVEIDAGQHSLVRQFCSGLTNMRSDKWGPDADGNRLAFARAVIERTRAALPAEAILGLRLSCDELAPWAGITPEAAAIIVAELAPTVDYLVVVRGSIYSADATRPDGHTPAGFNDGLAASIRSAVDGACPVFTQGSIVDPARAGAELPVEMTRALIADPDLVAKVRSGRPESVRPCLLCNQKCQVRDSRNPIVACVVNPSAGHEATEPESAPLATGSVQVIGAGPAGLEAARVCAEAGMAVTVWEAAEATVPLVRNWTRAAGRASLAPIADWLESECVRLGVEFRFGTRVDIGLVSRSADAAVIVATGGVDRSLEYAVAEGAVVIPASAALDVDRPPGPVAVWDPIGGPVGIALAESFAPDNEVVLITPDQIAGTMLSLTGDLAAASTRLAQAGVTIVNRHDPIEVRPGEVVLESRVDGSVLTVEAGCLIDAGHRIPGPVPELSGNAGVIVVGDAVAPRSMAEAILEGRRAAVAVAAVAVASIGAGRGPRG